MNDFVLASKDSQTNWEIVTFFTIGWPNLVVGWQVQAVSKYMLHF